jgi:hypothetical protein
VLDRVYQRTFIDTYSKLALHDRKTPITAAELLNDRPLFGEKEVRLSRVLTDHGINYCGNPEHPECELYISIENIDQTRTRTKSPQTNGIVERYQKTIARAVARDKQIGDQFVVQLEA